VGSRFGDTRGNCLLGFSFIGFINQSLLSLFVPFHPAKEIESCLYLCPLFNKPRESTSRVAHLRGDRLTDLRIERLVLLSRNAELFRTFASDLSSLTVWASSLSRRSIFVISAEAACTIASAFPSQDSSAYCSRGDAPQSGQGTGSRC
jgi:hypothetical protein